MIVFEGDQVTCNLSLSHRHKLSARQTSEHTVCGLRESARMLSDATCWCVESLSRGGPRGVADHVKAHRATLHHRHSHRLVLTPGKCSGVFTYERTLTCNFLLRFGSLPKRLSITFQCHTDVSVDFAP